MSFLERIHPISNSPQGIQKRQKNMEHQTSEIASEHQVFVRTLAHQKSPTSTFIETQKSRSLKMEVSQAEMMRQHGRETRTLYQETHGINNNPIYQGGDLSQQYAHLLSQNQNAEEGGQDLRRQRHTSVSELSQQ